ncbi:MAG: DUF3427 domain-containing protein [Leptospira sp.]|nr:DUF3427 domain-containing protein [Leptospira sp.]
MEEIIPGIYDRIIDLELSEILGRANLAPILRKIDDEEAPAVYSLFLSQILNKALSGLGSAKQVEIYNQILDLLSSTEGLEYIRRKKLLGIENSQLLLSTDKTYRRPTTSLHISSLLTGQGNDPSLDHEIRAELMTADRVDILVSFIRWSGLRLLYPAFEILEERNVPVRIISTSYMGVSDPEALGKLAQLKNVQIRVSYDPGRTRLHAKAYHFFRKTGYSAAYIGSANMTDAAMTEGLEWTVKVTAQDMPHILDRFTAEFETYWENNEYQALQTASDLVRFKKALLVYKAPSTNQQNFFAELTPRIYQERILEQVASERQLGFRRNLIVAATGTGKTVISAFDYRNYCKAFGNKPTLLYIAHRKEILEQALGCFRMALRDQNFGYLLVDGIDPFLETDSPQHLFASIQSLQSKKLWEKLGKDYFRFIILDEAHHATASSYRSIFDHFECDILLGLTATPERMDGDSILGDFENRFAAEIRLPEALDERLLCPFHYFGVSDNVSLAEDKFWKNGKFDLKELENVYTGDDIRAKQRAALIVDALLKYQPNIDEVRGIGFCASVKHAYYMAECFQEKGIAAEVIVGEIDSDTRAQRLKAFREGGLKFLFTVDVFNEGVDIPEINTVLFLRPTESLTIFLQQLGRGLRHSPNKVCLTVLDFIGQTHKKYRIDRKFAVLLKKKRGSLENEVEEEFPNLPSGCAIQLERIARESVLQKIRAVFKDLNHFIPEVVNTWDPSRSGDLTFASFLKESGISALTVLKNKTWSEWKSTRPNQIKIVDPHLNKGRSALSRLATRTDPKLLNAFIDIAQKNFKTINGDSELKTCLHYLMWGSKGSDVGVKNWEESLARWLENPSLIEDAREIAEWKKTTFEFPLQEITLPFPFAIPLHSEVGSYEIKANLGLATISNPGPSGTGVIHYADKKVYIHLVTFHKDEKSFSATTSYNDYPISRTKLHWQSQSSGTIEGVAGQNYLQFRERGYTILFFARLAKKMEGETSPFLYLGPAKELLSYHGERPISMEWELEYPMPATFFEDAKMI